MWCFHLFSFVKACRLCCALGPWLRQQPENSLCLDLVTLLRAPAHWTWMAGGDPGGHVSSKSSSSEHLPDEQLKASRACWDKYLYLFQSHCTEWACNTARVALGLNAWWTAGAEPRVDVRPLHELHALLGVTVLLHCCNYKSHSSVDSCSLWARSPSNIDSSWSLNPGGWWLRLHTEVVGLLSPMHVAKSWTKPRKDGKE